MGLEAPCQDGSVLTTTFYVCQKNQMRSLIKKILRTAISIIRTTRAIVLTDQSIL
jgi:hypothetical protein